MKKIKINKVPQNTPFTYKGRKYMWKTHESGNWTKLTYADGTEIKQGEQPAELYVGLAEVEIEEEE